MTINLDEWQAEDQEPCPLGHIFVAPIQQVITSQATSCSNQCREDGGIQQTTKNKATSNLTNATGLGTVYKRRGVLYGYTQLYLGEVSLLQYDRLAAGKKFRSQGKAPRIIQ